MYLSPELKYQIAYLYCTNTQVSRIASELNLYASVVRSFTKSTNLIKFSIPSLVKEQHRTKRYNTDMFLIRMEARGYKNFFTSSTKELSSAKPTPASIFNIINLMNTYVVLTNKYTAHTDEIRREERQLKKDKIKRKGRNKLSESDIQELIFLYTRHVPMTRIAEHLQVAPPAVRNVVLTHRLDLLPIETLLVEADKFYKDLTSINLKTLKTIENAISKQDDNLETRQAKRQTRIDLSTSVTSQEYPDEVLKAPINKTYKDLTQTPITIQTQAPITIQAPALEVA